MMQPYVFYHYHLENLSRSFSFCIRELFSPAREWVALSYLLCRVIDFIEDSPWSDQSLQLEAFQLFKIFLKKPPSEKQFLSWLHYFPKQLIDSERKLLFDLSILLEDKKQLPSEIEETLTQTAISMIDGMIYFLSKYKKEDKLILPSLPVTNRYCYVVAGIVGELLSKIFSYLIEDFRLTTTLLNQSVRFGLFLQKINLLKDKTEDEAAGRFYISSREQLHASLFLDAQHAFKYLQAIPIIKGRKYRLFCAWSLFIGLASLKWIDKSWQLETPLKISHPETNHLVKQISQLVDDNYALELLFKRYMPASIKDSNIG